MTNKSLRDYINLIESNEQGVAEGSTMSWIVYRQDTTLYPNGERDHETEVVKTFNNDQEAEDYANKLNAANRDYDVYYFVRGKQQGVAEALTYPQKHSSWSVQSPKKNEFNTPYKLHQGEEAKAHAERIGGKLVKVDQRGHVIRASEGVAEDLDANQKRVGQLGPTEPVGKNEKNLRGKLVGAESVDPEIRRLKKLSGV